MKGRQEGERREKGGKREKGGRREGEEREGTCDSFQVSRSLFLRHCVRILPPIFSDNSSKSRPRPELIEKRRN